MAVPAWFWPASGAARGITTAPFGAGFVVADWSQPQLWPFLPSGDSGVFASPIGLPSGGITSSVYPGLVGVAPAASGRLYALGPTGPLWTVPSGGVFAPGYVPQNFPPPSGLWTGLAAGGPSGLALMVASSGSFRDSAGSVSGHFGSAPARFAAADTGNLYTLLPALPAIGIAALPGGATGILALPGPLASPTCLIVSGIVGSGGRLAVGGWQIAPPLDGAAAAALNLATPTFMLGVGNGSAHLWGAPARFADAWSLLQSLSVGANMNAVAWRPDGVQALATSVAAGSVEIITLTTGTISVTQTLTISGACSVVVAGDSLHALIAQSGQAQATPLSFGGGTWSTGVAVTGLTGITALAMTSTSGAYAACTAGLIPLSLSGSIWTAGSPVALPFAPQVLVTDTFGQAYAAASGVVVLVSGGAVAASGTWAGGVPSAIAVQQGRIVMAIPSDGLLRVFGLSSPGILLQQSTKTLAAGGPIGLGLSATTLFALGSGGTSTLGFSGKPYQLTSVMSGAVGVYVSGTGWTTTPLGVGHVPSAITFDQAGNLQIATIQNTWWTATSGAAIVVSGIVPQFAPQAQTVPLGASSLISSGGHLYAATSIPGVLIELE